MDVHGDTAWWVARTLPNAGSLVDGIFETPLATVGPLSSWVLRQNGRAVPLDPPELRRDVAAALALIRERHEGEAPKPGRARPAGGTPRPRPPGRPGGAGALRRPPGPARSPARLVRRGQDSELDGQELADRFSITLEELEESLSLLNLVNFGGGCYTVYAELSRTGSCGSTRNLRRRLPPAAEADAARGARDQAGARVRRPDDRRRLALPLEKVRDKLEETFGQFELERAPDSPATPTRSAS